MSRIMVRYKVKPDLAETNAELVRAVYEELHRVRPSHIRYVTFQLDDGVTFVHLYANDSGDGQNALGELPSFRRFLDGIADRCDEPPASTNVHEIGSYRVFDHED
jgi:hypothetical protein